MRLPGQELAGRAFRALIEATPPGAARPSSVLAWNPPAPPATWYPHDGTFDVHWDWTAADALAVPGVWRARMLISQSIGGMTLSAWRGTTEVAQDILERPYPEEARSNTIAAWVCDLLDHGNAFGRKVFTLEDPDDRNSISRHPIAVEPVPATRVSVGVDGDGALQYVITDKQGTERYRLPRWQVFHAKGTQRPGDLRGMGVLEAGLSSITRMQDEGAYASRAFRSGTPSGLLRAKDPDLEAGSPDDAAGYASAHAMKRAWKESMVAGDIAVMSDLVDFTPLSWTPADAQMVEARQMSLIDVANLFNLDPYWVGASQVSAPYQNVQQAALQLDRFTLGFWVTALEAEFSREGVGSLLPHGQVARFNRDSVVRDDTSTRVANQTAYLAAGVTTVDEVRAAEGMPPLDQPTPASVTPLTLGKAG